MTGPHARDIAARFPGYSEVLRDLEALLYHALLLVAFALLCADVLPPALFMVMGLACYVRNFQALHEAAHSRRQPRNPLRWLRNAGIIVNSPLQFGRDQLVRDHHLHHSHSGDPARDPDVVLNALPWWGAVLHATFQPELGLISFVRRAGKVSPGLRRVFVYNVAMFAGLVALAGADIVWWIALTRLGSLACWFIFDWVLHNPHVWGHNDPVPVPRPLQLVWIALFSRDNLAAVQYHTVHHHYPFIASHDLADVQQFMIALRAQQDEAPPLAA